MKRKIFFKGGLSFLSLFAICFLIYSCNKYDLKDATIQSSNSIDIRSNSELSTIDLQRIDFTKVFVKALEDADFNAYLKAKYTALDLTDQEFAYGRYFEDEVSGGLKLHEHLKATADSHFPNLGQSSDFFTEIVSSDPLLTIDFPDAENFDLNSWTPGLAPDIIVYTESEIVLPSGVSGYPGYNSLGNTLEYLSSAEPTGVTLVTKTSETLLAIDLENMILHDGTVPDEIFGLFVDCEQLLIEVEQAWEDVKNATTEEDYIYFLIEYDKLVERYRELCVEDPPPPGSDCEEECERDCLEAPEMLFKYRIPNWSVFDEFDCGIRERYANFVVHVVPIKFDGTTGPERIVKLPRKKKGDLLDCSPRPCQGKWVEANEITWPEDWNKEEIEFFQYTWFETDNQTVGITISAGIGVKTKIKVPGTPIEIELGTSVGIKFEFDCNDDVLLGSFVETYCEKAYRPGNFNSTGGGGVEFFVGHNH